MSYGPIWYETKKTRTTKAPQQQLTGSGIRTTYGVDPVSEKERPVAEVFWCQPGMYVGKGVETNRILAARIWPVQYYTNDEGLHRCQIETYLDASFYDLQIAMRILLDEQIEFSDELLSHGAYVKKLEDNRSELDIRLQKIITLRSYLVSRCIHQFNCGLEEEKITEQEFFDAVTNESKESPLRVRFFQSSLKEAIGALKEADLLFKELQQ